MDINKFGRVLQLAISCEIEMPSEYAYIAISATITTNYKIQNECLRKKLNIAKEGEKLICGSNAHFIDPINGKSCCPPLSKKHVFSFSSIALLRMSYWK